MEFKRICLIDSVYSLLLYILISSEIELKSTRFFFSDGISSKIRNNFKHHYISRNNFFGRNKLHKHLFLIYLRILWGLRWIVNKNLTLWGHDHLFFSPALIGRRKIKLIEDGLSNYQYDIYKYKDSRIIKSIFSLLLSDSYGLVFGRSSNVDEIFLTGLIKEIPMEIKNKVKIIDPLSLFQTRTQNEKYEILNYFDVSISDMEVLKSRKVILFTQAFEINTENKIKVYKKILNKYNLKDVIIKMHPREDTDYEKYFPETLVIKKPFPIEIATFLGYTFEKAITINSAAVMGFNYPIEIERYDLDILDNL